MLENERASLCVCFLWSEISFLTAFGGRRPARLDHLIEESTLESHAGFVLCDCEILQTRVVTDVRGERVTLHVRTPFPLRRVLRTGPDVLQMQMLDLTLKVKLVAHRGRERMPKSNTNLATNNQTSMCLLIHVVEGGRLFVTSSNRL